MENGQKESRSARSSGFHAGEGLMWAGTPGSTSAGQGGDPGRKRERREGRSGEKRGPTDTEGRRPLSGPRELPRASLELHPEHRGGQQHRSAYSSGKCLWSGPGEDLWHG